MEVCYYGANSWLVQWAGQRLLIDPWLVGALSFGNQAWFFEARHKNQWTIPEAIDALILSQGLPDHAHVPTLEQLDRQIPVFASPAAAKVARKLGFSQVTVLNPGESVAIGNLDLQATKGAPVPQVENGYLLRDRQSGQSLYYEPHGFHDPSVTGPVTAAIAPIESLDLPLAGPIIQGAKTALELAQRLQLQVLLPTATGGDIESKGILNKIIRGSGSQAELEAQLSTAGLKTAIFKPSLGELQPLPVG
ncbi:MBL fold metallo-hydrolase [Synechococcus elongatus IITB7]|uniref:MBL fold metallo-hydrolase n=1 Tax=Synechococcus elongatus TaxID=32046 RepID=UPI0030CF2882